MSTPIRPLDEWIDSRRRHVERNIALKKAGQYHSTFLVADEEKWIREWEHHTQRVRASFGGRDDFLEIDITRNPGGTVCELLGVAEPEAPFPWANRGFTPPELRRELGGRRRSTQERGRRCS